MTKLQQDPHGPWVLTGVTLLVSLQSKAVGGISSEEDDLRGALEATGALGSLLGWKLKNSE